MNIIRISSSSELEEWYYNINDFFIAKEKVIPQNNPFWGRILNKLNKYQYEVLIACENGEILDYISYAIYKGEYGNVMISNPLIGYGGFVGDDENVWDAIIKELSLVAKRNSCVTMTISTPPYQENLIKQYLKSFNPDYVFENFYQYSTLNENHLLNQLDKKKRDKIKNSINKASRDGRLDVRILTNLDDWNLWIEIYKDRYKEIGALEYPTEFFLNIFNFSSMNNFKDAKLYGLFEDNFLIGGILVIYSAFSADYFSSAFISSKSYLNGTTFTLNYIFNELNEKKIAKFNWQSSPGKFGVYNYKKSWGAIEGKHIYLVKVTGDLDDLISTPLNLIKEEYKGMYILPYDLWKEYTN